MTPEANSFPEILARMTLVNVLCTAMDAKRESNGPAETVRLDFSFGFATQENQVIIKVRQDLNVFAADQIPFLTLNGELLVIYGLSDAENLTTGNEELKGKITRYAHMAAQPYLRALTADLANRLGVAPVTLGFLRIGAEMPESLTVGEKSFAFNTSGQEINK